MLAALKFCFAALILLVNTLLFCGLMLPFALLKLLLPLTPVRRVLDRGVYIAPALYEAGFVSAAHTPADIAETVAIAHEAFRLL